VLPASVDTEQKRGAVAAVCDEVHELVPLALAVAVATVFAALALTVAVAVAVSELSALVNDEVVVPVGDAEEESAGPAGPIDPMVLLRLVKGRCGLLVVAQ
jgi:hypothetical protein